MTLIVFIASLLGAMAIGVPVAFALMFCGVTLMWYMGMFNSQIIAQNMIAGADTFTLLAIPFFVLAGELMNSGGLSRRIIEFAIACVGHIRGGLGIVAIMAAVIMASISGSAAADTAALAYDAIAEVAPGGHFFAAQHTMERYQTAFYAPLVADLSNHGLWTENGALRADERATAIWQAVLAEATPPAACAGVAGRLAGWLADRRQAGGVPPED